MTGPIVRTLAEYAILTLFLVIGLGYLVGEISFWGFRLGLAAPLFGAVIALALSFTVPLTGPKAAGLYCGALTNTPALAATRERLRDSGRAKGLSSEELRLLSDQPVVAYSVAYPIGILGVLLSFVVARKLWRIEVPPPEEGPEIAVRDFVVKNPGVIGRTVSEVLGLHRDVGFVISRIRHDGRTGIARADTRLAEGDIIAAVGDEEALDRAQQIFGAAAGVQIELDRSELDYRRVFVSSGEVVGKRIRDLHLQRGLSATITRLRRGGVDVVPAHDTRLELGDRIRVLTRRQNFAAVSKFFGDSIRGTAETDFGSVAIGMVLGVMVGLLPVPLPGGQTIRLGLAGGPLLVALVLGKLEHTGRVTWVIPAAANLTLRQIGLLLFLAGVGLRAGYSFADTMRANGVQLLLAGAAITFGVTLATIFAGHKLLKIPFDRLMGLVSGVQTQPACGVRKRSDALGRPQYRLHKRLPGGNHREDHPRPVTLGVLAAAGRTSSSAVLSNRRLRFRPVPPLDDGLRLVRPALGQAFLLPRRGPEQQRPHYPRGPRGEDSALLANVQP